MSHDNTREAEEIDWFVPGDENLPWTGYRSHRHEVPEYFKLMWPVFVPAQRVRTRGSGRSWCRWPVAQDPLRWGTVQANVA
jgi:hypothetical protein